MQKEGRRGFPFLFGRAFIEAVRAIGYSPSSSDFPSFSEGLSLRHDPWIIRLAHRLFPFLFGRAFIEACAGLLRALDLPADFPSFSEGLSLRPEEVSPIHFHAPNFPSFSEGLSLRLMICWRSAPGIEHFPSFSEGLSLRLAQNNFSVF